MLVGLIGKPNTGKSSFFSAATMLDVPIANYPFTTIQPNVGVAYILRPCVHVELGVPDNPRNSQCVGGVRHIPVKLVDVAGLIPDASKGLGLGNKFLDELRRADALIHVVDASGSTDKEGRVVDSGSQDPLQDIEFVEKELDSWIASLLQKDMEKVSHVPDPNKVRDALLDRLAGLDMGRANFGEAVRRANLGTKKIQEWSDDDLFRLASELRKSSKPVLVAANKCDLPTAKKNIEAMKSTGRLVVPTSAAGELLLKKAAQKGVIDYVPGEPTFRFREGAAPSPDQEKALRMVKEKVLDPWGGTGVQKALDGAYFDLLGGVVVYPVEDENRYSDKSGNVLPDVYILPRGSTARDLAFKIHSDLGEGFLYAVDARSKQRLGAEHPLKDGDVVKIVSAAKRG